MNKKITVLTIMFLLVSAFLLSDDKRDLYLKAVSEKDPQTKMDLLKEYLQKYEDKKDKMMKFIYLNLSDAAYKLKNYDEAIQYGEIALEDPEVDPGNKLRVYLCLSFSYYTTKRDFDKAIQYAQALIDLCQVLIDQAQKSDNKEQAEQTILNYQKYFISPAYQLQSKALFFKTKDDHSIIIQATEKALQAYKMDPSESTAMLVSSLADNLYKKGKQEEAVKYMESIFDREKPDIRQANFLGTAYYKMKDKDKALYYFEVQYRLKPKEDIAKRIGILVHKKDPEKGLIYFADAFVLGGCDKSSDTYKYLEHLYFNVIAKGKSAEEKEQGFKTVVKEAEQRTGKTCEGGASTDTSTEG